jgi:hypothetical protein
MQVTELLNVAVDVKIRGRIFLNPNDAYDIGILASQAQFKLYYPDENAVIIADPGVTEFIMDPKQKLHQILLEPQLFQKLNKPDRIRLMNENGKILIQFE